jgi:hypothetical protein
MTQFDDRIEGEIKTHEKEMLRKAVIAKYGEKDLTERINYVLSIYSHEEWPAEKMLSKLKEIGLAEKETQDDVIEAYKKLGLA